MDIHALLLRLHRTTNPSLSLAHAFVPYTHNTHQYLLYRFGFTASRLGALVLTAVAFAVPCLCGMRVIGGKRVVVVVMVVVVVVVVVVVAVVVCACARV